MLGFVGRRSLRIRNDSETDDSREEVLRTKIALREEGVSRSEKLTCKLKNIH